jgi:hypothetical protein
MTRLFPALAGGKTIRETRDEIWNLSPQLWLRGDIRSPDKSLLVVGWAAIRSRFHVV